MSARLWRYSDAEETALRAAGLNPMCTPSQLGRHQPDALDAYADRLEVLLPNLRLAAAALRRELAAEPGSEATR